MDAYRGAEGVWHGRVSISCSRLSEIRLIRLTASRFD